jgi:hypothetical protein
MKTDTWLVAIALIICGLSVVMALIIIGAAL